MAASKESAESSSLEKRLQDVGLDHNRWLTILKDEVGITSDKQLKFLTKKEFERLKKHTVQGWQTAALYSLTGLIGEDTSECNSYNQKEAEEIKERKSNVANLIAKYETQRTEDKSRQDAIATEKYEEKSRLLDIPDDKWIHQESSTSFGKVIEDLYKCIHEHETEQRCGDQCVVPNPSEIVKNASGGLMLCGFLLTAHLEDCVKKCQQLIKLPDNIEIKRPIWPVDTKVIDIKSKRKADFFHRSLKHAGKSLALTVEGNGLVFSSKGDFSLKYSDEEEQDHGGGTEEVFFSKVICSWIPTGSIEMEPHKMRFSEQALERLKAIEMLDKSKAGDQLVQDVCENYFSQYGSHIYAGTVHVGGIYSLETTYSGKAASLNDKIKSLVQTSSSVFAEAGFSGLGYTIGGSISADSLQQKGLLKCSYENSDITATQLCCQTMGGPHDASSHEQWLSGLLSDSNTWVVMDRGDLHEDNTIGVWDLIRYQSGLFDNKAKISAVLFDAWKRKTGICIEDKMRLPRLIEDFESNVKCIIKEAEKGDLKITYCDALQNLQKEVKGITEATGTTNVWVALLRNHKIVSDFVLAATSNEWKDGERDLIRLCIKELLDHVSIIDFPQMGQILDMIDDDIVEDPQSVLNKVEYCSAKAFLDAIHKEFLSEIVNENNKRELEGETDDQLNRYITHELAMAAKKTLDNLVRTERHLDYVFIASLLLKLSYNVQKGEFDVAISTETVEAFTKESLEKLDKYEITEDTEKQVFLISQTIEVIDENLYQKDKEKQFLTTINPIRGLLNDNVKHVLEEALFKSPINLVALSIEMNKLLEPECGFSGLFDKNGLDALPKQPKYSVRQVDQEQTDKEGKKGLVVALGLSDYFPCKLAIQDVITLVASEKRTDFKSAHLSWVLLRHLIKNDSRWRDTMLPELQIKNQKQSTSKDKDVDDSPLRKRSYWKKSNKTRVQPSSSDVIHPLDILVTTLACCNSDLKLVLFQKLFMCKQALPLVYCVPGEDKPYFSLLPIRSLSMVCKSTQSSASVICAATSKANIVGFIRIGKVSQSKSELLNHILNNSAYSTFCYRQKLPRETTRMQIGGLIEVTWFLPSGKPTDIFDEVVTFLNLRGDAVCCKNELSAMALMATTIVAILDSSSLNDPSTIHVFEELFKSPVHTVLFISGGSLPVDEDKLGEDLDDVFEMAGKHHKEPDILTDFVMNDCERKTGATLCSEMRKSISILIKGQQGRSLRECGKDLMEKKLVLLDEKTEASTVGMSLAKMVYSKLCNQELMEDEQGLLDNVPKVSCKGDHLPLQGKLWREWSIINRKRSKVGQGNVLGENERLLNEMKKIRKIQLLKCNPLSSAMAAFIRCLLETREAKATCLNFIMWLKIFLNENSQNVLPCLLQKLKDAEISVREATDLQIDEEIVKSKTKASATEEEFLEACIGFEHFIRELGQIYESVKDCEGDCRTAETVQIINKLPKLGADLLLQGHALEIMDGDAANVPLKWVKAVLCCLENLLGDKKVFIVSVLGIQSSGKSTLLNAMFGLQFAVSSGRCTKGVFVQLIPVENKANDLYDFVLVIDTEGLRAPELGFDHPNHDNELATFVIGIGDVTLINIKGEQAGEIKDVLEIVVQAFLRLKQANNTMELKRKCIFIHQNVGAVNAEEGMRQGLKKFQENLDEMTRNAAEEENISDIKLFSQVIDFQGSKHVMYFPDLWTGDPPMAACNSGYSVTVDELLTRLHNMSLEQTGFISISSLVQRIEDLWNGIMAENFVFSFRNTLEVKAYNYMDTEYHKQTEKYDDALTKVCDEKCIEIELCQTIPALNHCYETLDCSRDKYLLDQTRAIEKDIRTFFDKDKMQSTLIQWKEVRLKKFNEMTTERVKSIQNTLLRKRDEQRLVILSKDSDRALEEKVNRKAKELAAEIRQLPQQGDLDRKFDEVWKKWKHELIGSAPPDIEPVNEKIRQCLFHRCDKDRVLLETCLINTSGNGSYALTPLELRKLEGSWNYKTIDYSTDLSRKGLFKGFKDAVGYNTDHLKKKAVEHTDSVFRQLDRHIEAVSIKDVPFQNQHARGVVDSVMKAIKKENDNLELFTFTSPYIIRVIVHVCQYAVFRFEKMKLSYNKKHGIKEKLKKYKAEAKILFMKGVKHEVAEVVAADLFCNRIKTKITEVITAALPKKITDKVVSKFSKSKYHVMVAVLDDLATKGLFESYQSYIKDSYHYVYKWMETFINKTLFDQNEDEISHYMALVNKHVDTLLECIKGGIVEATKSTTQAINSDKDTKTCVGNKMKKWAKYFEVMVKPYIAIPAESLKNVTDEDIASIDNFLKNVLNKLKNIKEDILKGFQNHRQETVNWGTVSPYEEVMEILWGCPEQCPFCREPCQHSKGHAEEQMCHACIQHRPMAVSGRKYVHNKELELGTCNFKIQSTQASFMCRASDFKCRKSGICKSSDDFTSHEFMKYKTYLPEWDIAPSATMDKSSYWRWFIVKYKHDLAHVHCAELPYIPESWEQITVKQAKDSLRCFDQ